MTTHVHVDSVVDDAPTPGIAPGRVSRAADLLATAVPVAIVVLLAWSHRWVADDAFIHLRVVENIVDGNGPVFNAGQRVEASTSPLWVFLLAPFAVVGLLPLEWWAVLLGILGTACGVFFAQRASLGLDGARRSRLALPLGALIFVSLLPVWEFTTSGLENGLGFAWQGGCFLLLVRTWQCRDVSLRSMTLTAAAISLGTLIRPDFGIFYLFYAACLLLFLPRKRRTIVLTVCALVAVPVAYQIFRMGYFASLAPSAALAKEASSGRFSVGYEYFRDFVDPYLLVVPLSAVTLILINRIVSTAPRPDHRRALLLVGPVITGIVHALYVVRVGGDFMHGRMLLPSLFAVLLPVFAVRASKLVWVAALLVVSWSAFAISDLRPTYAKADGLSEGGYIADERAFYLARAATLSERPPKNPVTIEDYGDVPFTRSAWRDAAMVKAGLRDIHAIGPEGQAVRSRMLRPNVDHLGVTGTGNIGMYGYAVGNDVLVADPNGLADVVAAHLRLDKRGRPGHEKELLPVWFYARYAQAPLGLEGLRPIDEQFAARALQCGELREMVEATSKPLDAGRFLSNIIDAPRFWNVRIPNDPFLAERQFCDRPS